MLKALLENKLGCAISKSEFRQALEIADADIKFNRVGFKKKTHLEDVLLVLETSIKIGR